MGDLRQALYLFGFLPSIAFFLRVAIQWIQSETKGKSSLSPIFWKLSLLGNSLLFIHSLIQSQLHVALVQGANFVVAYRNLDLMQAYPKMSKDSTLFALMIMTVLTTAANALISWLFTGKIDFIRTPTLPWDTETVKHAPFLLHLIGSCGLILFSSRFWVQWWFTEQKAKSQLSPSFWWMSLLGGLMSLFYFSSIGDPVNLIGPLFGCIAYTRNLVLIRRAV